MNIGIDASRIAFEQKSGTENYTLNLILALQKIDKENHYTLYFNKLPDYFEISQTNVSTKYLPMTRFWTQVRLALECLVNPPDVLFVPAHTIPIIRRPNLPTVVTIHDLGEEFLSAYHKFPQKLYLNWMTKYVARAATNIVAVSESTKKDLVKTMKVNPKRIKVIHEGVDTEVFKKKNEREVNLVRSKYGLTKNYFLYVGTIQPRKNLVRLIEAFSKLKNKKVDLVLVGKPGWLYDEIYKAPKKLGVEDRVKFIGFVENEELVRIYNGALAFVFPSLFEGFGLPLLEAMATGLPVLTSNTSSMPEVTGGNAVLINPNDTEEIIRGMNLIIRNESLRQELANQGLAWVKNFSWEKTAAQTLKVLEEVYKNRK